MDFEKLCFDFLISNSEIEIENIILNNEELKNDANWFPVGGFNNNVGTILNQQKKSISALTEKIINSIDAVLIKECKKNNIDPESIEAPKSMKEAVEKFFGIREGDFSETSEKRRRELANNIIIVAQGEKNKPCLTIVDKGDGQNPSEFEETFLSLHKNNKTKIRFVQGKFNMGGTGALAFCGKKHYQLIVSKKYNSSLNELYNNYWGFTLIRYKNHDNNSKNGIFEYFKINNLIPKFNSKEILSIAEKDLEIKSGTIIKMYNYELPHPSNITFDLWRDLNRTLYDPAIPIVLYEARNYKGHSSNKLMLGNRTRLKVDDKEKVEEVIDIESILGEFGLCKIKITVLKNGASKTDFSTPSEAVFFTLNGQTHDVRSRSFLKSESKANLNYLGDYLVVSVDLTNIPNEVKDHTFMSSRDRMRENEDTKRMEDDLAQVLKKHEGLKELNLIRRELEISSISNNEELLKTFLTKAIKDNQELAKLFGIGTELRSQNIGVVQNSFEGKKFPSYLKIKKWNNSEILKKHAPINTYILLYLETDAENQYLGRDEDPGKLIITDINTKISSHLYNGLITIKLKPLQNWLVGEEHKILIELTRPFEESLFVEFIMVIDKPSEALNNPPGTPRLPRIESLKLPRSIKVYKEKNEDENRKTWNEMPNPWDENDVCLIRTTGEDKEKQYDVYINMDSKDLSNYLRREKYNKKTQNFIKNLYEITILLYSIVIYNDLPDENRESQLPDIMKSISKVCLDLNKSDVLLQENNEYE